MKEEAKKALDDIIYVAKELVTRVDTPEKIPDTCYRGDVSRWNFGYYLSRREKLGKYILESMDTVNNLSGIITTEYGDKSDETKYYNRRMEICRSYQAEYNLEIADI